MVDWMGITEGDLKRHADDRACWEQVWTQISPILDFAERIVSLELEAFCKEGGKDRVAMSAVRKKEQSSFVEKMLDIASDEKRYRSKFQVDGKKKNSLRIFDLVTDLVGARLIFYFERDIQEAILFWLGYPAYVPLEVTHWFQDVGGYDTPLLKTSWLRSIPGIARAPKKSGYESFHLVLTFAPEILRARHEVWKNKGSRRTNQLFRWQDIDTDDVEQKIAQLQNVTFEVQCRTILEHTWAEVEHRSRYSPVKSQQTTLVDPEELLRTFRNYKAILHAAQMFQNSIRTGFARWDSDEDAIIGRSTNVPVGARAQFWDDPVARGHVLAADTAIANALKATKRGISNDDDSKPWWEAIGRFETSLNNLGGQQLLELKPGWKVEEYGRRRVLLQLLGVILGYAWAPGGNPEAHRIDDTREQAAKLYLEVNLPKVSWNLIPPRLVAVRLYEHLRILDESYFVATNEAAFHDPLVMSRAASVHYRHFGSFRRATKLLKEAIERIRDDAEVESPVLTKAYLGKRLAESYWTAYHLEGRRLHDLLEAIAASRNALEALPPIEVRTDDYLEAEDKVLALLLTMELYHAAHKVRDGQLDGAECGWNVLEAMVERCGGTLLSRAMVRLDRYEATPHGSPENVPVTSLRMQGRGIWLAAEAFRDPKKRDKSLVVARRTIRRSRQHLETRLVEKLGGALQFHVEVAREIEGFVFSLCSDDQRSREGKQSDHPR